MNNGKTTETECKKKLVTLIARDFFEISSALNEKHPELITEEMDDLRLQIFYLDDRAGELLDCSLEEIIPALDDLKAHIEKIEDGPYYRSALKRLRELFTKGYDKAAEIYQEKLDAQKTLSGSTKEEIANAAELLKSAFSKLH